MLTLVDATCAQLLAVVEAAMRPSFVLLRTLHFACARMQGGAAATFAGNKAL